jgi:hypothetical protein
MRTNDIRLRNVFQIAIISDCKPAIQSITGATPKVNREWYYECLNNANSLHKEFGIDIKIIWAPGHSKIEGNEKADVLAKEAVSLSPIVSSTTSFRNQKADELCIAVWKRKHINSKNSASRWITKEKNLKSSKILKDIDVKREVLSRYVQTITGHGHNANYYDRFLINHVQQGLISSTCKTCKESNTIQHILQQCPSHSKHRHLLRKIVRFDDNIKVKSLSASKEGRKAFLKFLEKSGAFTKDGQPFIPHLEKPIRRIGMPAPYIPPKARPPPIPGPEPGSLEFALSFAAIDAEVIANIQAALSNNT